MEMNVPSFPSWIDPLVSLPGNPGKVKTSPSWNGQVFGMELWQIGTLYS